MTRPLSRRSFLGAGAVGSLAIAASPGRAAEQSGDAGETYLEPARAVPIVERCDVVVCGAGPAGVAAAVSAARAGARTRLIEVNGCLGGIWTAGLLGCILDASNKAGVMQEILRRLDQRKAFRYGRLYDPEMMKIVLDELCAEAGVSVRLHTQCAAAAVEKGRLKLVVTESKSGREAFAASAFVDATGDGDLAVQAGCGWDYGRPDADEAQPMSFIVMLTGIRTEEIRPYVSSLPGENWSDAKDALAKKIEEATGALPSYGKPTLFPFRDDVFVLMANHEYGFKGYDADDLTRATFQGRAEVHRMIDGLRSLGGPLENIRICNSPERIGVRESRRIRGRYTISTEDIERGARFDDAVCQCRFGVDVHSTNPHASTGIDNRNVRSQPFDLPYRSLLPVDVDGLLTAGRCISGDFYAHSAYRVTGNSVATGEAAGVAAALAARTGRLPHDLPWAEIQKEIAALRANDAAATGAGT